MDEENNSEPTGGIPLWVKLAVGVALIALAAGMSFVLPVRDYLQQFLEILQGFGLWGLAILSVSYVAACVLFIPGFILTVGAGFLAAVLYADNAFIAVAVGTVAVSLGSVAGACVAFLLGRTLARDWVDQKVSGNTRFKALDEAIGKSGLKVVFLTRLSPLFPFNMLNYMMGVTKVRFRDYLIGSWIGMLPGTVLYVYIGTTAKSLTEVAAGGGEGGGESASTVLLIVGLIATFIVVALVTRVAKKTLDDTVNT